MFQSNSTNVHTSFPLTFPPAMRYAPVCSSWGEVLLVAIAIVLSNIVFSRSNLCANTFDPKICTPVIAYTDLNQRVSPSSRCKDIRLFDCFDSVTCIDIKKWRDGRCDCLKDCSDECENYSIPIRLTKIAAFNRLI